MLTNSLVERRRGSGTNAREGSAKAAREVDRSAATEVEYEPSAHAACFWPLMGRTDRRSEGSSIDMAWAMVRCLTLRDPAAVGSRSWDLSRLRQVSHVTRLTAGDPAVE